MVYRDVAEHIRDGDGLVTDLSMYHEGMPYFQYPTPIYPLWLLLFGYASRLAPIAVVATWLPAVLWGVALVLGDRLARTLRPAPLVGPFDAGHLFLIGFGMNEPVFMHTTRPYTEGLAFVLLFGFLLRLVPYTRSPTGLRAAELGVWLGLLLLTRSQLIVVWFAMGACFAFQLVFSSIRRRVPLYALATLTCALLTLSPWLVWLSRFTEVTPTSVLSFQTWQVQAGMPVISVVKQTRGAWGFIADRWRGVSIAFDLVSRKGYRLNFGLMQYAPFVVLPLAWRGRARLLPSLRSPGTHALVFLLILGAGWMASVHAMHKQNFSPWNFQHRHAAPVLALLLPCLAWLLARGGAWRIVGSALLFGSVLSMGHTLRAGIHTLSIAHGEADRRRAIEWVRTHAQPGRPLVVAASNPAVQELARQANGIGLAGDRAAAARSDRAAVPGGDLGERRGGGAWIAVHVDDPSKPEQPKNPLHGLTLAAILDELVAVYGWEELYQQLRVQCFLSNPSVPSSLKFLRRTPWAREKLESYYLWHLREQKRRARVGSIPSGR